MRLVGRKKGERNTRAEGEKREKRGRIEGKERDLPECHVKMVQWMAVSSKGILSSLWNLSCFVH